MRAIVLLLFVLGNAMPSFVAAKNADPTEQIRISQNRRRMRISLGSMPPVLGRFLKLKKIPVRDLFKSSTATEHRLIFPTKKDVLTSKNTL